jgi:signal transduction histidine kinase
MDAFVVAALAPTFVAGVVSLVLAVVTWRRRQQRVARPFFALALGLAVWSLAYGVELAAGDLAAMVFWDKVAFVGSVTVPAAWFLLSVEYAGVADRLPDWTPVALVVEPLVVLGAVWRYPGSRLVWETVGRDASGVVPVLALEFGPLYWLNFAYSYCLMGAGLVLIASVAVRGRRIHARQATLLIGGALVPLSANAVFNLVPGASPVPGVDLTTFAMATTALLYALVLFRFQMLDVVPAARETVLETLGDGFVVLNGDGDVIAGNEVGERVLAGLPTRLAASVDRGDYDDLDQAVVSVGDESRTYELAARPVEDFRGETVGTLLVCRDITELAVVQDQERRLSVLNRLLRHNVRNEMSVIGGYGETLAARLDGTEAEMADTIQGHAQELAATTAEIRYFHGRAAAERPRVTVDVNAVVAAAARDARSAHPSATVTVDADGDERAVVTGRDHLRAAVDNLLENAVVHNDRDDPTVRVTVDVDGSDVRVAVADDGPGIPAIEREVLSADVEDDLDHGSGLGLWIVQWFVSRSGGDLAFRENDPRGSVVTMHLPAAGDAEGATTDEAGA